MQGMLLKGRRAECAQKWKRGSIWLHMNLANGACMVEAGEEWDLDACTDDDAGEEVAANNACDSHHDALHAQQHYKQHGDEVAIVREPRM